MYEKYLVGIPSETVGISTKTIKGTKYVRLFYIKEWGFDPDIII